MQITDEEILTIDELDIDMRILNAIRVNIHSNGVTLHSIRVKDKKAAQSLVAQILEYQEALNESEKISAGDNRLS